MERCVNRGVPQDIWEIYRNNSGEWEWTRKAAGNYEIVGASTEGYVNKADCITNAQRNGMTCTPTPVAA